MIIRGGAGGDNISSLEEAGGSITGGCGSVDVGTGPGETTVQVGIGLGGTTSWDLSRGR